MIDKYIKLYQETKTAKQPEAVQVIKDILLSNKADRRNWTKTINEITQRFETIQKNNIVNSKEFSSLLKAYRDGRKDYEEGCTLLAIPNELKTAYDKCKNISIKFEDYVFNLATEAAYSYIRYLFYYNGAFQAMYKIGRFDNYEHFTFFDVKNLTEKFNSQELLKEVNILAYKTAGAVETFPKAPIKKPFEFRREFIVTMRSDLIYSRLEGEYFNDLTTDYNTYLNVFFDDPNHQNSNISLSCETQLFARLLSEMKNKLFKRVSYKEIEKNNLFTTRGGNILTANNITKSSKSATATEIEIVNNTIAYIQQNSSKG
tara:strand:- start:369190 stop:370137 length:948 start_codon:yes stop_codon:yes gene_type:complete